MKTIKEIFAKILMVSVMLMAVVMPTFADNGCENDDNDAIAAEFALCSTHAYNIGNTSNPTSAERDLMRDVVAMKTELITQQMYRHYEQMESMLRRFKTQLEKAVLTTNLQAAGASKNREDTSDASYKQTNMNIFMTGIKDCNSIMDALERVECFNENYTTIYNMSGNGTSPSTPAVKKQLGKDYELICNAMPSTDKTDDPCKGDTLNNCKSTTYLGKKANFQSCLNHHRSNINKLYNEARSQNAQWNNPWMNNK